MNGDRLPRGLGRWRLGADGVMHCESCRHVAPDVACFGNTIVARCPKCSKTVEYIDDDGVYRFKEPGSSVKRVSDDG